LTKEGEGRTRDRRGRSGNDTAGGFARNPSQTPLLKGVKGQKARKIVGKKGYRKQEKKKVPTTPPSREGVNNTEKNIKQKIPEKGVRKKDKQEKKTWSSSLPVEVTAGKKEESSGALGEH